MGSRYQEVFRLENSIFRGMDSLMVESNIRKMGRLDLLHICTSNLVKQISRDGNKRMLKGLESFLQALSVYLLCNKQAGALF